MEAKGTALEVLPRFVVSRFGREELDRWMNLLSREARLAFSEGILLFNWYPLKRLLIEPTLRLCELFYNGRLEGALEVGRFSAEYSLKGVYKLFVKMGSPEFLIGRAKTILPTFYRPCALELIKSSAGTGTVRITDFREMHPVIEMRIKGWMEKALEISGCRHIRVTISKSLLKGDSYTEFIARYD